MLFTVTVPFFSHIAHMPLTLMSIATQTFRDFEVVVCDDASPDGDACKALCEKLSEYMPSPIRYIRFDKNEKIGVNRQRCFDNAKGDYIVSVDSDDLLYSCLALETYQKNILAKNQEGKVPDVLQAQFMEAHENGVRNVHQAGDSAWVHAGCFRRQFLADNKITFPTYEFYEDGGFMHVVNKLAGLRILIPDTTYLWTHTAGSIVRSGEYIYRMLHYFTDSFWRAYKIVEPLKGRDNCAELLFNGLVMPFYYLMGLERRYPADDENIAKTYTVLKDMIENSHIVDRINEDERYFNGFNLILRNGITGVLNQDPYFVGGMPFNDWLKSHFGVSIKKLEADALQGVRETPTDVSMFADRIQP